MALFGEFSKTSPRLGRNNTELKYHDTRHSYLYGVIGSNGCILGSPDKGTLSPGPGAYTGDIIETPRSTTSTFHLERRVSSPSLKTTVVRQDMLVRNSKLNTPLPGPGA